CPRHTLRAYFGEGPSVAIEHGFLARLLLPAEHRDVAVLRILLDSVANPLSRLGGRESRSAADERVINQFAAPGVVQDRAPHQLDRLLRRVVEFFFVGATHDELRGGRIPDRRVLASLAEPRRVFLSDVPAGLMLKPVVRPGEHGASLVPDDLLMVQEAD